MKKITLISSLLLVCNILFAQADNNDFMRSIGKIYVVVAVIVMVFIGVVLFLFYLDRKLTKIENQIKKR